MSIKDRLVMHVLFMIVGLCVLGLAPLWLWCVLILPHLWNCWQVGKYLGKVKF